MPFHFEEIWEQCENFQKDALAKNSIQSIIEELILKINLYKTIDLKENLSNEDRGKVKSRLMGEILLTLTALSLKDNINVYDALNITLQYKAL